MEARITVCAKRHTAQKTKIKKPARFSPETCAGSLRPQRTSPGCLKPVIVGPANWSLTTLSHRLHLRLAQPATGTSGPTTKLRCSRFQVNRKPRSHVAILDNRRRVPSRNTFRGLRKFRTFSELVRRHR